MPLFLAILIFLTLLLTFAVGAMSFNLHSSDPAGNGLALVYILFFSAVLWAFLGLILLIVALRDPHPALPTAAIWRRFAAATLLLFVLSAASQLATIRILSDRSTPSPYALALQITVFTTPIAFLLYAAWRTYGLTFLSPTLVAALTSTLILASYALPWPRLLTLQHKPSPASLAPTIQTLRYPALLIWDNAHPDPISGPDDLAAMHTSRVLHRVNDPVLIDSVYRAFTLEGLKVQDNSLKLLATGPAPGTSLLPVEFTLTQLDFPARSQTARDLILACPSLNPDPARDTDIRKRIAHTELLEYMLKELRGEE